MQWPGKYDVRFCQGWFLERSKNGDVRRRDAKADFWQTIRVKSSQTSLLLTQFLVNRALTMTLLFAKLTVLTVRWDFLRAARSEWSLPKRIAQNCCRWWDGKGRFFAWVAPDSGLLSSQTAEFWPNCKRNKIVNKVNLESNPFYKNREMNCGKYSTCK